MGALNNEDFERIKKISDDSNRPILERLADGERRFANVEAAQAEHAHILKGNGSPGVEKMVDRLWQIYIANTRLKMLFIGSAITIITIGVAAAAVFLIRLMK